MAILPLLYRGCNELADFGVIHIAYCVKEASIYLDADAAIRRGVYVDGASCIFWRITEFMLEICFNRPRDINLRDGLRFWLFPADNPAYQTGWWRRGRLVIETEFRQITR